MLQMAAAAAFGPENYAKLDPLTISLSHPDATAAFISGTAGVNAHFSSSPFYEQEIKVPGRAPDHDQLRYPRRPGDRAGRCLRARKFRDANPKVYQRLLRWPGEAIDIINKDKPAAARLYLEMSKDKLSTRGRRSLAMIADKDYAYTLRPAKVLATATFMAKVGAIKQAPGSDRRHVLSRSGRVGGD